MIQPPFSAPTPTRTVLTVYQLNYTARQLLENHFQLVWIAGEISNLALPRSGHIYFTLKDDQAQVRCALFKNNLRRLNFAPLDGMAVVVYASVSLYEGRGDYQLIITHMEQAGVGQLQQAYEALKARLSAAGLFDEAYKKPLPAFPKHIGVVTSGTGAALQDILHVLKRRYPLAPVSVYHTAVQGKAAAPEIIQAIRFANEHKKTDVLILARGGGSLEDLWAFNEESVARAILSSDIPIVTGIGHEVDFTIADYVASARAPTPSAAAETISPDSAALLRVIDQKKAELHKRIHQILQSWTQKIDYLARRLIAPHQRIAQARARLSHLEQVCYLLIRRTLERNQQLLSRKITALNTISPLATLARGYAIVNIVDNHQKHILRSSMQLSVGQTISAQLAQGGFEATVQAIHENASSA